MSLPTKPLVSPAATSSIRPAGLACPSKACRDEDLPQSAAFSSPSVLSIIAIQGIVYCLLCLFSVDPASIHIASFDLGTEAWRANLPGPVMINGPVDCDDVDLTSLNGCLVLIHQCHGSAMDLWFLMDFEKGLWVKQYSIR
ncbi:hypothetical protein EJB05_14828, partial [Eragrostis curvula]